MAYCRNCGEQIHDEAVICVKCGVPVVGKKAVKDEGGILWGLIGFFVPVAGLIIFLIWKDEQPNNAKAAGIGALIYMCASITLAILYVLFFSSIIIGGIGGFF